MKPFILGDRSCCRSQTKRKLKRAIQKIGQMPMKRQIL